MMFVVKAIIALHGAKVRQYVFPSPARIVVLAAQNVLPFVVIGGTAAHINLCVDRRTTA
jgi:hypothetical protein